VALYSPPLPINHLQSLQIHTASPIQNTTSHNHHFNHRIKPPPVHQFNKLSAIPTHSINNTAIITDGDSSSP
jgi:hypothetical protein